MAFACVTRACGVAKSFGHSHHTWYQIACVFALLGRRDVAFDGWKEASTAALHAGRTF